MATLSQQGHHFVFKMDYYSDNDVITVYSCSQDMTKLIIFDS